MESAVSNNPKYPVMYLPHKTLVDGSIFTPGWVDVKDYPQLERFCKVLPDDE